MAANTITVADGLVTLFNALTGLPETFTAVRVHEATTELTELDTIKAEVRLGAERSRTRVSRGMVNIKQDYLVTFRKRISGTDLSGENALQATVDDWVETMESVEAVATKGTISTVKATIESVTIVANVSYEMLRENSLLASVYTYRASWHEVQ